MSTPFDVKAWARQAGIQTTGGFAVVAECVTLGELQRFAEIAISQAAKHYAERDTAMLRQCLDVLSDERYVSQYSQVVEVIEALKERLK